MAYKHEMPTSKLPLSVRHRTIEGREGVIGVECVGLITDASIRVFWQMLREPDAVRSAVSMFDVRKAIIAYRSPPRLVAGAPQLKPGAYVCRPDQYDVLADRCEYFNALNVRRAVFLSWPVALDWALSEVRLLRESTPPLQRAPRDSAFQDL